MGPRMTRSQGSRRATRQMIRAVSLSAVLVLVFAACGGGQATPSATTATSAASAAATSATAQFDAVIAAGKTEGQSVWYGTEVPTWTDALGPMFKKNYGIDFVAAPRAAAGAILQRIAGEETAGAVRGDVLLVADFSVWVTHPEWFIDLDKAGLPNYANYPKNALWANKCAIVTLNPAGILYNNKLVDPAHAPKTWKDLLDPYWKGKFAFTDPRSSPTYNGYMFMFNQDPKYGPDFLKGIAAQKPDLFQSASPAAEQVSAGAYLVSWPSHLANSSDLRAKNAPLTVVIPPDPPFIGSVSCAGILAKSPHPNAAKVMLNFLMSPEAQSAGCSAGVENSSFLPGTTCKPLPAGWVAPPVDPKTGEQLGQNDAAGKAKIYDLLGVK